MERLRRALFNSDHPDQRGSVQEGGIVQRPFYDEGQRRPNFNGPDDGQNTEHIGLSQCARICNPENFCMNHFAEKMPGENRTKTGGKPRRRGIPRREKRNRRRKSGKSFKVHHAAKVCSLPWL